MQTAEQESNSPLESARKLMWFINGRKIMSDFIASLAREGKGGIKLIENTSFESLNDHKLRILWDIEEGWAKQLELATDIGGEIHVRTSIGSRTMSDLLFPRDLISDPAKIQGLLTVITYQTAPMKIPPFSNRVSWLERLKGYRSINFWVELPVRR